MRESDPNARKRTDPRPAYIELGDDTDGAFHVYRTTDETIHVVQDGERVQKFVRVDVEGREWANRHYVADDEDPFAALLEQLADATEVTA